VFAVHRDVISILASALRKKFGRFGVVTLFGGTPPRRRQENIDRFQTDPKCRVFIGQVVAAGTAITLTAAHDVLFAEASWNPADNAQAAMRCHRIGQDEPVFVRFVSAAGTIDERIQRVLRRKTETITQLFG
jgi:SWI/SNF-related matrix-associated actin-dependent regulator 1 of chromatin subfamily A